MENRKVIWSFFALVTIGIFLYASFSFFSLYGNKITGAAPAGIPEEGGSYYPPLEEGICDGTALSCDSFDDSTTCTAQLNCEWDEITYCGGKELSCDSFTNSTYCNNQGECKWILSSGCGNGIVNDSQGETCDDGNIINGDGCSSQCLIETGWECGGEPSFCSEYYPNNPICVDSDGGEENLSKGGFCFNSTENYYYDDCINETHVKKYFCGNLNCNFNVFMCPENFNCEFGECRPNITELPPENNGTNETLPPNFNQTDPPGEGEAPAKTCPIGQCGYGGKCYGYGIRIGDAYCSENGGFIGQKITGVCGNHFECKSNICSSEGCVNWTFLQRAKARFYCMFTGEACRGTAGKIARAFGNPDAI